MNSHCDILVTMTNLIMTISDYANYGNRLQNYALQTVLSDYGVTTTAHHQTDAANNKQILKRIASKSISTAAAHVLRGQRLLELMRVRKGITFTKRYVPDNQFTITAKSGLVSQKGATVHRIIIGSDQVWNPQWITNHDLALRLGAFAPQNCPIISYAASFGVSSVSDDAKRVFQKYLPRFKAVSVREFQGATLVEEMTGLKAEVVLDPTLMVNSNKWINITEKFVNKNEKYVLTYFLGQVSDEQERDIQEFAKARGLKIRRILDFRDPETYVAGPQDFVELFAKAEYIFTDSYHACCFSVLFHKQFTVFNRAGMSGTANMNSRMETLFKLLDIDHVVTDSGVAPTIDYSKIDTKLTEARVRSAHWLNKTMQQ